MDLIVYQTFHIEFRNIMLIIFLQQILSNRLLFIFIDKEKVLIKMINLNSKQE